DKLTLQDKANKLMTPILSNMEKLALEIDLVARKDPETLVKAFEKSFNDDNGKECELAGPLLGLSMMGEDGVAAFYKFIDSTSKNAGPIMIIVVKTFGPKAVIPTLKQCEDPSSTAAARKIASTVIFSFPENEEVYDKVAEAYIHGRYFKMKEGKMNMADMMAAVGSWWGNFLKAKYRDNKKFIDYVARSYLKNPDAQPKIIEFLADTNFGIAAPYFLAMDFTKLPEASLEALGHVAYVPIKLSSLEEPSSEKNYKSEKFSLYCALFKSMSPDTRAKKQTIIGLSGFPPEYKELFVESNIGILTDEEKITIAFSCSNDSLGREKMPQKIQQSILKTLRNGASQKVLEIINYMDKKIPI
ncbi:MAG: hypothetical protein WCJ59_03010, partial [bacterium]